MKPLPTSFHWLLLPLALAFFSCEKEEAPQPALLEKTASDNLELPPEITCPNDRDVPGEPISDCQYPDCLDAIEDLRETYLPLANSLCDTLWFDITCCQDGQLAMALVFVAPGKCGCFPVATDQN